MAVDAPSTLHARLEEFLGLLVDRHVPQPLFVLLRQVSSFLPMLRAIGAKIPAIPPDLPASPADLKRIVRRELYARPTAELAGILALAEGTVSAWLAEYEASQTPSNPPSIPEDHDGSRHDETAE